MINVQLVDVSFTDYDVTQVQVVDHDLCDSHEDFFALYPPVVTWNYHALIKLRNQPFNSPQTVT